MFNIVTYMWCNWMRNINKVIQKPIRIKSCVINRHIHTDTLSVQWHPRWVFSPGLQDCSFASWLCETLLLYAFSSLHYTENNCNTWRLRYLLLCSWLYKDSPNNRVQFGFHCIHIMVIFKHVFLLFLFWMWIRIPRRHPPVCALTGMATNRSWERGQFGGQHVGHSPWCDHSATVTNIKIVTSEIAT